MLPASPWLYIYPQGLQDFLVYVKQNYESPIIYITENGKNTLLAYLSFFLSVFSSLYWKKKKLVWFLDIHVEIFTWKWQLGFLTWSVLVIFGFAGLNELNNKSLTLEEALCDDMRLDYHHEHLGWLHRAIRWAHLNNAPTKVEESEDDRLHWIPGHSLLYNYFTF